MKLEVGDTEIKFRDAVRDGVEMQIDLVDNFQLRRTREGNDVIRFGMRFSCVDGAANLEWFKRKTKNCGQLRIWYVLPAPPPKQAPMFKSPNQAEITL